MEHINIEMTIDQLMQMASTKRWTIWTVSMIPGTAQLVISGSPLCTPSVEKMYNIPVEVLDETDRLSDFLREMNKIGGWPPEVVSHQSQLLNNFRKSLPVATVTYAGEA